MTTTRTAVIGRIMPSLQDFLNSHVLGLATDPEFWPEPDDVGLLPVRSGIDRSDEHGPAWVLDYEYQTRWPRAYTLLGAQAYRFTQNADYDCGWRLVDVAARFLSEKMPADGVDMVVSVPPPATYSAVAAILWAGKRLAMRLGAEFSSDLLRPSVPLGDHPDRQRRLPVPLGELYRLDESITISQRRILLVNWRWDQGRVITVIAKLLRRQGAVAVRFAWLP
ncbi:MAG: hypothetical protein HY304_09570 [candidate division Zixibacteria bacterium]|nr:hypothetical protein [candidate division Zixibacteria bacterium]